MTKRGRSNRDVEVVQAALRLNEYIPDTHEPTDKQAAFLCLDCEEAFYGGAGGGGKSEALLMGALQYADVPGYSAGLFRRQFADLSKPGGLIDLSHEYLSGTAANWNGFQHRWTFPCPKRNRHPTLSFGGMKTLTDSKRYAGSEYQYEGFDELPEFERGQYMFMGTRLRRRIGLNVPLRKRGAGNPGGVGHAWVKKRMIDGRGRFNRIFIKAVIADNPHVDQDAYIRTLSHLDAVTKARILEGNWDVHEAGQTFRRGWVGIIEALPGTWKRAIRYWDLAATKKHGNNEPDWTAGALMFDAGNLYPVADMKRMRGTPGEVEDFIVQTAHLDRERYGSKVTIGIEEEGGSGGKNTTSYYRKLLAGFHVHFDRKVPGDSKKTRFNPVATQAQGGNVPFLSGRWNEACLDELEALWDGVHDDQADAISGAFAWLTAGKAKKFRHVSWLERVSTIPTRRLARGKAIINP